MRSTEPDTVIVAAAAIKSPSGEILVTKRPDHAHQGGLWEFPGGKLEPGETPEQALVREVREELGLQVEAFEPLIRISHSYPDKHVVLQVYTVTAYTGRPVGMEGQPMRWILPGSMDLNEFPAADRSIITALCLPDRYLITGRDPSNPARFIPRLEAALSSGVSLVQLRAPEMEPADYRGLARAARAVCKPREAKLILNAAYETVLGLDADGWHLNRHRLMELQARPEGFAGLIGASCHDERELKRAEQLGLDYALLSPVNSTRSHPDVSPLGWERFEERVMNAAIPVYALGGMSADDIPVAKRRGGQGIAAIGAFWPGG